MRRQMIMTLVMGSLLAVIAGIWMGIRNRRNRWNFGMLIERVSRIPMMRTLMSDLFWKRMMRRIIMVK
jgi:hypothetical protein